MNNLKFNLQREESSESGSIQQQVLAESDSTKSIVDCVMAAMSEQLKTTIAEHVSISVKSMANSVADIITESLNDRMTALETENKTLKEQINKLTVKVQELETHKRETEQCIDTAEQYSRRYCLRISGIPESHDECTYDVVLNIARAIDVDLSLSAIDISHRVRLRRPQTTSNTMTRPSDIIAKFLSYRSRAAFFKDKSFLKMTEAYKRVYINEDLTRFRVDLLRSARLLVRNKSLMSAWSFDGRIFVKCPDGSRHLIHSTEELHRVSV